MKKDAGFVPSTSVGYSPVVNRELARQAAERANDNAEHTPGPWSLGHETSKNDPDTSFRGPFINVVAGLGFSLPALAAGETMVEARANARLIAAAPELLEALEQAAERFDFAAHRDKNQAGLWATAAKEARAVAEKARGGNA